MRSGITLSVLMGMIATGCGFWGGEANDDAPAEAPSPNESRAVAEVDRGGVTGAVQLYVERRNTPFALDDDVAVTAMTADGQTLKRRLELRESTSHSSLSLRERLPAAAQRYVCGRDFPRAVVAAGGRITDSYHRRSGEAIGSITVTASQCGDDAGARARVGEDADSVFHSDRRDPRAEGESLVAMANANAPRAISDALDFRKATLRGTRLVRDFRVEPTTERIDGNVQALLNQDLCASTPYRRFLDAGGVIRHHYEGRRGGPAKDYNVTARDCRGVDPGGDADRSWQHARYETARRIIRDVGVERFTRYLTVIGAPDGPGALTRTRAVGAVDETLIRELEIKGAFLPLEEPTRREIEGSVCDAAYLRAIVGAGGAVRQVYFAGDGRRIGSHRVEPYGCESGDESA